MCNRYLLKIFLQSFHKVVVLYSKRAQHRVISTLYGSWTTVNDYVGGIVYENGLKLIDVQIGGNIECLGYVRTRSENMSLLYGKISYGGAMINWQYIMQR